MKAGDMPVVKDPTIKLFGRKIPLPESTIQTTTESMENRSNITKAEANVHRIDEFVESHQTSIQHTEPQLNSQHNQDSSETNNSTDQEVAFKKPDKIIPCPRCNSFDTKFCYFNNYNVNQPRHFCKNCQRYWTAGGTMRNVPIGAGRRKNKQFGSSSSQYHHGQILVSSDGVQVNRMETIVVDDSTNPHLQPSGETEFTPPVGNGTVLKFGREAPLCESMDTTFNLDDKNRGHVEISSLNRGENGREPSSSCCPSVTFSNRRDVDTLIMQTERRTCPELNNNNQQSMPFYPVPSWVLPSWVLPQNTSQEACKQNISNPSHVQWCPTPMMAFPGFCPPNIALQFVPAPYWGSMPVWTPGAANLSIAAPNGSPTLGKHSRDSTFEDGQLEKCILVPKTLRTNEPDDASNTPIWTTLGIEHDHKVVVPKGGIFKPFDTEVTRKDYVIDGNDILEANPAALSRSHTFQEST